MNHPLIRGSRELGWNPIPGTNRAIRAGDGSFLEVVKAHPIPAFAGRFWLQLSPLFEVLDVEIHGQTPVLFVSEKICGAISVVPFLIVLDYPGSQAVYDPTYLTSFFTYGHRFHLLGSKRSI